MVGRFLVHTQYGYHIITTTGSGKNRLHIIAIQWLVQRFRIEVTDYLNITLCFTHNQIYRCSLSCLNWEEFQISQHTTVCQTSTRHHNVVTFVKRCTLLQQIAPSSTRTHIYIAFIVVEQLKCTSICQLRDREMRIILRVFQCLDRLVGSNESTSLCFSRSRCFKVYINHTIRFADHLNLTCHFVNT